MLSFGCLGSSLAFLNASHLGPILGSIHREHQMYLPYKEPK